MLSGSPPTECWLVKRSIVWDLGPRISYLLWTCSWLSVSGVDFDWWIAECDWDYKLLFFRIDNGEHSHEYIYALECFKSDSVFYW